jgi:hypothetical protein
MGAVQGTLFGVCVAFAQVILFKRFGGAASKS